jgi:hypothetical protein
LENAALVEYPVEKRLERLEMLVQTWRQAPIVNLCRTFPMIDDP